MPGRERTPVLYLAPWIDFGGSDKNTIDWFRGINRERFAPSLITTQPSPNRRLREIDEFVEEVWVLPDLMPTRDMPAFIFDFIHSRRVPIVHLMNSRLGFDLLPDFRSMPNPPRMVVQLHAEEADKSGYVRYVTTRYADFVDRFSLTMVDLENAVHEYGVLPEKTKVIYIGVDAEEEFSPEKVEPIDSLPGDRMHVIFPARLVQQKDPLLMVEVAAALRDRGVRFQVHVLGEGELEDEVRAAIGRHGLGGEVLIHPPTSAPERWYAACDAMLLTSVFEGIPAALFEAMAMELPVVSPALPGHVELLGEEYDGLVEPRDSVAGYVEALARLAADETYQATRGRELRARALQRFSLQRMADEHGDLYDEVLEQLPERAEASADNQAKASNLPALSIVSLHPHSGEAGAGTTLSGQTCADAELLDHTGADSTPMATLLSARPSMRGGIAVVTSLEIASLLDDPAFVEKVLRRFTASDEGPDAIAFVNAGDNGHYSFRTLPPDEGDPDAIPHTVAWRVAAEQPLPRGLHADPAEPIASIARLFSGNGAAVEWHHLPGSEPTVARPSPQSAWQALPSASADSRREPSPALPGTNGYEIPRWKASPTWIPTLSVPVTRYRERDGERRIVTSGPAPAGFVAEHCLGALRTTSPMGTERLLRVGDDYLTAPRDGSDEIPAGAEEIGSVELAPFPQLDCLALAVHRSTGQNVLVTLPDDPIVEQVDVVRALGFIEPVPLKLDRVPDSHRSVGLVGLVKAVDHEQRRHHYAIGSVPAGELVGELGALAESELQGSIAAWIVNGRLVTERHRPPATKPSPASVARWTLEPASWSEIASLSARTRTVLRRGSIGATRLALTPPQTPIPAGDPAGWLFEGERPGLVALHVAYHPVTGDQLLTRSPQDAREMGYDAPEPIGYIRLAAPVTGDLSQNIFPVPWARRFGAVPRVG